jgi:predicted RecB family nuclease
MYCDASGLRFAPTDLMVFQDSEFGSWMDRWQAEKNAENLPDQCIKAPIGPGIPDVCLAEPDPADEESRLLQRYGAAHETRFLESLRQKGLSVAAIVRGSDALEQSLQAIRSGVPCVYQAYLESGNLSGIADFLVKAKGESRLGPFHYEVLDTKLARSAKPGFIIQLCAYTEMLASIQGACADRFGVVLGDGRIEFFPTDRFWFHYQRLKAAFVDFQNQFDPCQLPHPGGFRSHGRWSGFAERILDACDHLGRVANITVGQIKKLETAGIMTATELSRTPIKSVPRLADPVLTRLKTQAALQIGSRDKARPDFSVLPSDPDTPRRGLALLPPASPGDVYFDMEGFPLLQAGLEYLFGAVVSETGDPVFLDWWAHDAAQEKQAFEAFMDFVHDRWTRHPDMHIYHYAAYEKTAVRRLAPKHATRERKLDDLLRNEVFVDLYTVVRQGLVVGTPSYSLKDIERLYLAPREGEVKSAVGSIVAYQKWLDSGQPGDWRQSKILAEIRDYNRIDCESLRRLCEWLRPVQQKNGIGYVSMERSGGTTGKAEGEKEIPPSVQLAEEMWKQLKEGNVPTERVAIHELLAGLLEFHWREARPIFWRMFERHAMTHQELADDLDCLGDLTRTKKPPTPVKRSRQYEYAFNSDQDTKLHVGSECYFSHDLGVTTTIMALDPVKGRVEIKLGPKYKQEPPARLSLIPNEHVSAAAIANAIYRYTEAWTRKEIISQSVDDLLHRRRPRIHGYSRGALVKPDCELVPQVTNLVSRMDGTTLCIQGPPGTGKTFTAAAAIVELLRKGKRIGVTANSHKVILNLMDAVAQQAGEAGIEPPLLKVGGDADEPLIASGTVTQIESVDIISALGPGPVVVGGTAWAFSRSELAGKFDYLFVDEAGQFSLANVVGSGLSARNLVLVGDQMQLAQPILGTHPGLCGVSALDYLLNGKATVPDDFGVFLGVTRRMHPRICDYVSGAFYEGRLVSHASTELQRIQARKKARHIVAESGLVYVPVDHDANAQASDEECETIERIVEELIGRTIYEGKSKSGRRLTFDDILFVAPFNMQVRRLQQRLGDGARVGSVDKFQGQEAHVVIVSMCSSSIEDSPRGVDFLLDPNRLNVAVSRAKTLSVVVGSPKLMAARCQTIREMELVNLMCRLVDHARCE